MAVNCQVIYYSRNLHEGIVNPIYLKSRLWVYSPCICKISPATVRHYLTLTGNDDEMTISNGVHSETCANTKNGVRMVFCEAGVYGMLFPMFLISDMFILNLFRLVVGPLVSVSNFKLSCKGLCQFDQCK